jgi:phosphomevalonate kinase
VLDRHYTGTVFALDARIHAIVQQLQRDRSRGSNQPETPPTTDEAVDNQPESIIVRSPQFIDAVWEYGVQRCEQGGGVKVTQRNEG